MKPDVISHIGPLLESARNNIIDLEKELRKQHPDWQKGVDARLTVFNKCSNVLAVSNINLVLLERYLSKEGWWKINCSTPVSEETIKNLLQEFEMFNRIGLIHFLLASIESSFRLFLYTLDSTACNGSKAEFKSVYDCLLKKIDLQKYTDLLDIWRNIRNCLHNNGLFFPPSNKNQPVSYKGTNYNFQVGRPLDFVNTTTIVELLPDIIEMLRFVVESRDISNLREVVDSSA